MYKGKKQQTGGTQQQIKCVYVPQDKVWKLTVQWGKVNVRWTFFVVEHSIVEEYANYFDVCLALPKYVNTSRPAKPVAENENENSTENDKLSPNHHERYDCLSELDMELAEQYASDLKKFGFSGMLERRRPRR